MKLEWKEINLPWHVLEKDKWPERPDLTQRRLAAFPDYQQRRYVLDDESREYHTRIHAWEDSQPDVIAWRNAEREYVMNEWNQSFVGRNLNLPGTFVAFDSADGEQVVLIGHVNTHAGFSGEEVEFEPETIIKRYATLNLNGICERRII